MVNEILSWLFGRFPVKSKKILFISHLGKGYGCNPKYICEFLRENHNGEFELHWVYDPICSKTTDIPEGIKPVSLYSRRFIYDIHTCGVLVSNTRLPDWFHFKNRKGQRYIQTWHSSLRLKKIEGDANLGKDYEALAQRDSKKTSIIISGCKFSSDIYRRAFWYNGPLLEVGTPRIDFLLKQNNSDKRSIYTKANLDQNTHYVLYAPTFRKGGLLNAYNIDYKRLITDLSYKFGGQWKVLFRLHPNLLGKVFSNQMVEECIDVTTYDDIQELLIIADLLITDFSSCMFDMGFLRKPCILYASDFEQYVRSERNLYFDMKTLPFPLVKDNDNLSKSIESFDKNEYARRINSFLSRIGSFENGTACEDIFKYISRHVQ